MNHYLQPAGFLGTGASLATDLTLMAYLLLIIPGMLAGLYFARKGHHRPAHKWVMITITVVNTILILGLMVVAYQFDVVDNIGSQPDNFRYLMPTIHALFGFPAQVLAIIIVVNMLQEDRAVAAAKKRGETDLSKYWWNWAKPVMRLTLALWLITATFGVVSYLIRYDVLTISSAADTIEPVVTEEPATTPEVTPEMTDEPDMGMTEEAEPMETEEADSDETEEPDMVMTEEADAQGADEPMETEEPEPAETEDAQPDTTEEPDPASTEEADE